MFSDKIPFEACFDRIPLILLAQLAGRSDHQCKLHLQHRPQLFFIRLLQRQHERLPADAEFGSPRGIHLLVVLGPKRAFVVKDGGRAGCLLTQLDIDNAYVFAFSCRTSTRPAGPRTSEACAVAALQEATT